MATRAVQDGQHHKRSPSGRKCSWFLDQRTEAFMDIRIFDPMAACYQRIPLEAAHQKNDGKKSGVMEIGSGNVDHGSFTPLVFTTSGGVGPKGQVLLFKTSRCNGRKEAPAKEPRLVWMRCRLLLLPAQVCPPMSQGY
ncbi:hypothetical protein GWK47_021331 [Chionoecetes opilio]|uniref:Uncharacterized protein n=1 Tax=Chionoecetes opilio TaxID=41210 RepID=A0A8J4XNR8_CHIOP|nr:hypothetical protein GWK47_021331 [Chionoecetes opilio]